MQVWVFLKLLIKYLPQVIAFLNGMEEHIEETIVDFKVIRSGKKIDIIFESKKSAKERASDLDSVFNSKLSK